MDSSALVSLVPMQFNYQKFQIDLYNIYYLWPRRCHAIYSYDKFDHCQGFSW